MVVFAVISLSSKKQQIFVLWFQFIMAVNNQLKVIKQCILNFKSLWLLHLPFFFQNPEILCWSVNNWPYLAHIFYFVFRIMRKNIDKNEFLCIHSMFFSDFPPAPTYSKYLEGRSEVLLCLTHNWFFFLSLRMISKCVNKYSLILICFIKRHAILSNIQKNYSQILLAWRIIIVPSGCTEGAKQCLL